MGERMIGMIRSMDANRDGKFELKELPEHRRRFAKMMLERSGFDTEKAIDLKKIEQKVRERFGGGGGNNEDGEPPLVPGFGLASEGTPPPTFGTRVETEEEQNRDEERRRRHEQRRRQDQQRKIEAFAKSMMEKGDRNKNRLLEKHLDEWDAVRGDPEEMDRNNDKRLTLNELIVGMNGRPVPDSSPFPKGAFRFLSYYDRLPEGVPEWFLERDQNKNAQLEMNEYTDDWNRAAAEEFTFLDRNNDGVVTVEECFTTLREVEEREEEQSEERPQNSDGPPQMADGPRPGRVPSNGESVRPRVIHREEGAKQVIVRPSGGPGGDGDRNSRGR
jgi:Ca2+-binding EF-hand superfamily protein